jgi:hypothetical protein
MNKNKNAMRQEPDFITIWKSIIGITHELKVFFAVDKCTGFCYYTCIIDNEKTFVISRLDSQQWQTVNGETNVLSEKLGEIVEQYNTLCAILKIVE